MEIRLNNGEDVRVKTGDNGKNFLDISSGGWETRLKVSFMVNYQYMQLRKKNHEICAFYFESKRHEKDYDFGVWEDAEVVFSNNEVELEK